MTNAELIAALRYCGNFEDREGCDANCPYIDDLYCPQRIMLDAAAALEAAEKRIAIVEEERDLERFAAKNYLDKIDELKAQMPKEGVWLDEQRGRWIYAKCNLCGKVQDVRSNYCPNCGAKMKTVTDCHTLGEGER